MTFLPGDLIIKTDDLRQWLAPTLGVPISHTPEKDALTCVDPNEHMLVVAVDVTTPNAFVLTDRGCGWIYLCDLKKVQ